MRNGTPKINASRRTLEMLEAVIIDNGSSSVSELARRNAIPIATAHRQVTTLVAEGYLAPSNSGRHVAGPRLLALLHRLDEKQVITNVAAPLLHALASELRTVVQLGTLENDMVTYRIKTGRGAGSLFTRVGMQLEAYCSGMGKVLLAHMPPDERAAYVSKGAFIPLTRNTIVDPDRLNEELDTIFMQSYAIDDSEVADGLRCLAVPIRQPDNRVLAAISASQSGPPFRIPDDRLLERLSATAHAISLAAFG